MHIQDAKLYKEIIRDSEHELSKRANPKNVEKHSRYFKDGYDAWGNSETEIKEQRERIAVRYPDLSVPQITELGKLLFQHGKYEMGSLAIMLLEKRLRECDKSTFDELKSWFDFGVGNWAHADYLCSKVTPWFLIKGIVDYKDFEPWLHSDSRWTRRACPVSFIKIKKEHDPVNLMGFIEPLMTDPERVVHQGTGWFLRELWKVQPRAVEDFLYQHRNTAARLIIQYATEKIAKEERIRFRKDKAPKA